MVLLDGTLIRTRRRTGTANRKNYSGKYKCHGLLVIALTDDRGRLLWASAARPGRSSEITACRHDQLTAKLRAAGLGAIADLGFVGLDDSGPDTDPAVITGYKAARNRPLTRGQKLSNKALAAVRAPVDHGFAHLKGPRQGPHRPEVGDRPGQSPAGPDEPRSLPLTDDLHGSHPPATSPSIENPAHTRSMTCNFTMHTAQCTANVSGGSGHEDHERLLPPPGDQLEDTLKAQAHFRSRGLLPHPLKLRITSPLAKHQSSNAPTRNRHGAKTWTRQRWIRQLPLVVTTVTRQHSWQFSTPVGKHREPGLLHRPCDEGFGGPAYGSTMCRR
ncbi:transposase [Streptomyces europaeiscabiei]|nr:transposase [Streptomyces europaeiscabiei]